MEVRISDYESITAALDGLFEQPLRDLPGAVQCRVLQVLPIWDDVTPRRRRVHAFDYDFENDPDCEPAKQRIFDLSYQIATMERLPSDEVQKNRNELAELRSQLRHAEHEAKCQALKRWGLNPYAERVRVQERFRSRNRGTRKWIGVRQIADYIAGVGSIIKDPRKREATYHQLRDDLVALWFDQNGRSQVLCLDPELGTYRVTADFISACAAVYRDSDIELYLEYCYIPSAMAEQFFARHGLGTCPGHLQAGKIGSAADRRAPNSGDGRNGMVTSQTAAASDSAAERDGSRRRWKPGRPPIFSDDEKNMFIRKIVDIADSPDGLPAKQAELLATMEQWCRTEWGESRVPGETTLKQWIRRWAV